MIHFHMQSVKIIGFVVIEVRFFKFKKKMKNMEKNEEITYYIKTQPIFVYWLFLTHSSP